jgi:hypothetical protein
MQCAACFTAARSSEINDQISEGSSEFDCVRESTCGNRSRAREEKTNMKLVQVLVFALAIVTIAPADAQQPPRPETTVPPPLVDHHQHLFSPAVAALISPAPPAPPVSPITSSELIPLLDAAGVKRAAVLSVAYIFGQPTRNVENEYEKVRAENDWTSQQVALFPDRLRSFCGLNPLKDYALAELARCAKDPNLHYGLKLHFGNSTSTKCIVLFETKVIASAPEGGKSCRDSLLLRCSCV